MQKKSQKFKHKKLFSENNIYFVACSVHRGYMISLPPRFIIITVGEWKYWISYCISLMRTPPSCLFYWSLLILIHVYWTAHPEYVSRWHSYLGNIIFKFVVIFIFIHVVFYFIFSECLTTFERQGQGFVVTSETAVLNCGEVRLYDIACCWELFLG